MSRNDKPHEQHKIAKPKRFQYDLGSFRRTESGTYEVTKDKDGNVRFTRIASHAVRVLKILFVILSRTVEVYYVLRFHTGNGPVHVRVRHSDLNEEKAFLNAAPPGFSLASAHRAFHKLRELFMLDLAKAEHVAVVTTLGWFLWKGQPVYAHAAGIIRSDMDVSGAGAESPSGTPQTHGLKDIDAVCSEVPILIEKEIAISQVLVELPDQYAKYRFEPPGSRSEVQAALRKVFDLLSLGDPDVTYIAISALFLVAMRDPRFALFLHGETGSLKTAFALLLLSFFVERPEESDLASFKSTENALRARFSASGNAPVVIDDFIEPPGSSQASPTAQKADNIIRSIVNGNGKERSAPDGSLRPNDRPRGLAIVTGEQFPTALESLKHRTMSIQVDRSCFEQALEGSRSNRFAYFQHLAAEGTFRKAMAGFLAWTAKHFHRLQEFLDDPRHDLAADERLHRRLPDAAGDLASGMAALLDFAREVEALSDEEFDQHVNTFFNALEALLERAYLESLEDRPTEAFGYLLRASLAALCCHIEVVGLRDYVETASGAHTIPLELLGYTEHKVDVPKVPGPQERERAEDSENAAGDEPEDESENGTTTRTVYRPHGPRIGWLCEECLDLIPEAALAAANSMAAKSGGTQLPNKKSFGKMLASQNWIAAKNRDRNTCKARHGDAVMDVWRIHAWRLFEPTLGWGTFDIGCYNDMTSAGRQQALRKEREERIQALRRKLDRFQVDQLLNPHLTDNDRREFLHPEPPEEDEVPGSNGPSRRYQPLPPPSPPEPWEGDGLLA